MFSIRYCSQLHSVRKLISLIAIGDETLLHALSQTTHCNQLLPPYIGYRAAIIIVDSDNVQCGCAKHVDRLYHAKTIKTEEQFLPVQTRSLVEVHAADWYEPDGHAPEQTIEIMNTNINC